MSLELLLDAAKFLEQQEESSKDEGGEEGVTDEAAKREVVFRRAPDTYSRSAPTNTTHHHYHHHHHHTNNHGGVASTTPPPATRTAPSSPGHAREEIGQQRRVPALTPPMAGGVRGVSVGCGQQGAQQQTSPRTCLSYPGSPASSPPHLTVTPRGSAASPLGLLSAFRHDSSSSSSSPPSSATSGPASDPALTRLSHDALQPHLTNGLTRPNGLSKSLSLSPSSHNFTHHGLYSPEDPAFKDDKKRSGSTPSREVHNKLEKNRRAHLKECFETLRRQLPSMDDKKISNQTILKAAHRHIQTLKRKEREYEHEMERLAREKIAHQQKLSALKKELSARWDHIDFNALLPDMASLEQHRDKETKSTTTASEQPDLEDDSPRDAGTQATSVNVPCTHTPRLHAEPPRGTATFATINNDGSNSIGTSGLVPLREHFVDPNQPLNLSTSIVDSSRVSPRAQQIISQGRSPHNSSEWGSRQASPHYTSATYTTSSEEDTWPSSDISTVAPTLTRETITSVHSEHLPIMGSTGIHLPAQLVAGGMQLNGAPGGLLGQPAIQVITPEGYKLLPADHAPNGTKPLTITLAHPAEGLERGENSDDVKTSAAPMMVALNKNGVSALHLAVPTARSLSHAQGTNGTVPLNLSVGGAPTVKVTQAATSSLLSSYLPITHANGITQLVSGLGGSMGTLVSGLGPPIVTPLVVSQPQRAGVPGTVTTVSNKGIKTANMGGSATSVPLVSTQYTTSLASGLGGLVKPVVVVSAPAAVTGLMAGAHTVVSGKP